MSFCSFPSKIKEPLRHGSKELIAKKKKKKRKWGQFWCSRLYSEHFTENCSETAVTAVSRQPGILTTDAIPTNFLANNEKSLKKKMVLNNDRQISKATL